jgi:hypothetical protein
MASEQELLELLRRCRHYIFFGSGQGHGEQSVGKNIPQERRQLMHDLHNFFEKEYPHGK